MSSHFAPHLFQAHRNRAIFWTGAPSFLGLSYFNKQGKRGFLPSTEGPAFSVSTVGSYNRRPVPTEAALLAKQPELRTKQQVAYTYARKEPKATELLTSERTPSTMPRFTYRRESNLYNGHPTGAEG